MALKTQRARQESIHTWTSRLKPQSSPSQVAQNFLPLKFDAVGEVRRNTLEHFETSTNSWSTNWAHFLAGFKI